ncbi:hypothetical protein [Bosea sp. MMO-172]|uniref:hypothetical protein n=1 Tax=Bosea sp. MMO-172 TaxID=3127885 RepID=UPI003018092E
MNHFKMKTPYGEIIASWQRDGQMIVVRYGERTKKAQASDSDEANLFVARDIARGWIAADLKEGE